MRHLLALAVLIDLTLVSIGACAQSAVATEGQLKAAYIYHFIQFTQWPAINEIHSDELFICIEENNPLLLFVKAIEGKLTHGKPIVVAVLSSTNLPHCHVRVLGHRDSQAIDSIQLEKNHTLVVADDDAANTTATIALHVDGDRITFVVNRTLAQKSGLEISSKLLRLAETVQ